VDQGRPPDCLSSRGAWHQARQPRRPARTLSRTGQPHSRHRSVGSIGRSSRQSPNALVTAFSNRRFSLPAACEWPKRAVARWHERATTATGQMNKPITNKTQHALSSPSRSAPKMTPARMSRTGPQAGPMMRTSPDSKASQFIDSTLSRFLILAPVVLVKPEGWR
jgi:hypothetical protein